jgi:hypothetical protein
MRPAGGSRLEYAQPEVGRGAPWMTACLVAYR